MLWDSLIFGEVGTDNHKKLFKSWWFTDSCNPQHENTKVRILQMELALRVIYDELADVHQAEFILSLLLWSHRVSELPELTQKLPDLLFGLNFLLKFLELGFKGK